MSVKAMTWAFEQKLSGNDKVILLCIADHVDENLCCWPSLNRVAERACVSRRTVINILAKLEEAGFLTVEKGGGRKSNKYTLTLRGANSAPVQPASPQQCNGLHPSSATAIAPEPSRTIIEPDMSLFQDDQVQEKPDDLEQEFESWWKDEYPERHGSNSKKLAKAAYLKHRKTATKEQIWNATLEYFNHLVEEETPPKFVKMATSFLNSEPWNN